MYERGYGRSDASAQYEIHGPATRTLMDDTVSVLRCLRSMACGIAPNMRARFVLNISGNIHNLQKRIVAVLYGYWKGA